jgi:hypothetical protein
MSEVCTPMPLEVRVMEDFRIMERIGKIQVQVNENSFMGHHNRIIHTIHLLPAMKPLCVVGIILGLPNFDNHLNAPRK